MEEDSTLTADEWKAVRSSVQGTIDLLKGYCTLRPEDPRMARKQNIQRKRLLLLRSAQAKLKNVP
jgi:hypothetical protein